MDKNNRMYRLGLYEKAMPATLSWEEKLQVVKNSGFDYLEMSIDETDEKLKRLTYTNEDLLEIIEAMYKVGVKIESICLSAHRKYPFGSHDVDIRKRSMEIMEQAIDIASKLGIRIIQLAGYDVYYESSDEQSKQWFEENLKKAVHMAAKKGILLGFETMETPFMDTVEKAMYYVHKVNSPYLGVYPDIGNLKNASLLYDVSVNEDLMKGKGSIIATHLKETVPGKYREIPYGSGHSEFVENIQVLKELGVRMFVGEFWYKGEDNWYEIIEKSYQFLQDKLTKGFIINEE